MRFHFIILYYSCMKYLILLNMIYNYGLHPFKIKAIIIHNFIINSCLIMHVLISIFWCINFLFYRYENLPWQYIKMEVNLLGNEGYVTFYISLFFVYAVILFNWLEIRQSFWQVNGYKWFFIVRIILDYACGHPLLAIVR